MNAIIATFENGKLMPQRAGGFFRYHDGIATEVKSTGHVESHVVLVTLRRIDRQAITEYVTRWGDVWCSVRRNLAPGWYIDVRGEDGTIWAFSYEGYCIEHDNTCSDTSAEEAARKDFAEAERVYSDWVGDDNDIC